MIFCIEDEQDKDLRFWRSWSREEFARDRIRAAGYWFVDKWRSQAQKIGYRKTASNMRKQGVPIEVALATLLPGAALRGTP